ncbi:helix-turn-helix transcriptional regulator [Streptomyces subrutilus]|uniref:helix-turn-helix transcriptional regulator n=1 Tax=Streptomyces subrutilus TaxID=36818 RepID=UPI00340DCFEA
MGRPQKPVPQQGWALAQLALRLRAARDAAGFTYEELAARTGFGRSTLQRAASGAGAPPPPPVVVAYALGCGVDPGPLLALREKARIERQWAKLGPRALRVPHVRQIMNEAELGAALYRLHVESGMPTYRDIQLRTTRAAGVLRVTKTTAHLIMTRRRIPSSPEQLKALLFVYGVGPAAQRHWLAAWARVARGLDAERAGNRDDQAAARVRQGRLAGRIATVPQGRDAADHDLYQRQALQARFASRGRGVGPRADGG